MARPGPEPTPHPGPLPQGERGTDLTPNMQNIVPVRTSGTQTPAQPAASARTAATTDLSSGDPSASARETAWVTEPSESRRGTATDRVAPKRRSQRPEPESGGRA